MKVPPEPSIDILSLSLSLSLSTLHQPKFFGRAFYISFYTHMESRSIMHRLNYSIRSVYRSAKAHHDIFLSCSRSSCVPKGVRYGLDLSRDADGCRSWSVSWSTSGFTLCHYCVVHCELEVQVLPQLGS